MEPERLERGLVLILTGIEGRSFLNIGMLSGLIDGGVQYACEIVDWTTGNKLLFLLHLRWWSRNNRVARSIAQKIIDYQNQYPGRPVWLVGHSGGGGMALLTSAALPNSNRVTGIILLAAAVSPEFDPGPAAVHVRTKIWNYYSPLDFFFLVIGTTVAGTLDGCHRIAAGAIGFRGPSVSKLIASGKLVQIPWNWRMIGQFNPGDHFGCMHRVFVAEEIAPKIMESQIDAG